MKFHSILREAWRDIATGTARTRGLAISAAIVVVLAATADLVTIHQLQTQAREFKDSGAAISVLSLKAKIDGGRCDALGRMPGVRAAGAIRATKATIKPTVIPGAPLAVYQSSPGFITVIRANPRGAGVLLGPEASDALGIHGPGVLATSNASVPVAGSYTYPNDGRRPGFSYAAIAPEISTEPFDECWVDTWPVNDVTTALLSTVRTGGPQSEQPVLSQLNTTHGKSFDGESLFERRVTRFGGIVTAIAGYATGLVSVRIRKLSLASALHAGVTKRSLFGIITLETLAWSAVSAALGSALVVLIAAVATGEGGTAFLTGVVAAFPILSGALAGAWTGVMVLREENLFNYFKSR